jgi:hypothetical protein
MADERYIRWQGLAIAQLTVAVALISGFSVAGLGVGLSLIQNREFLLNPAHKCAFGLSLLLLLVAAFFSCGAVITRMLDFKLTARQVRKKQYPDYKKSLKFFGSDSEAYGRATWRLFWSGCVSFALGAVLLVVCIGVAYADRWH